MGIIKLKNANEEQTKNIALNEQPVYGVDVEVNENTDIPQENQEQWQDPAVLYEDESRTDEHTRHYVMNNGTAKSVFNAESVSYFDEESKKWKPIDNTLKENADVYESKNGNMRTKIYKANKGKKVEIAKSDKQLSWEYLGKQVETVSVANENVETFSASVLKVNNDLAGKSKNINSSAVYENIEKDTDLEYCLRGNNLKENIIVREKSADYRYLFALKTEGLKIRLSEDNESLELYTESTKDDGTVEQKVEFTIPAPFMYDANGVASDDVYYELEPSEDGKFTFAVVANEEWVNAADRVFPITIDPQVVTSQNNLVTKQTYYRDVYSSYGSGSGSGISYSNWHATSSTYIKVYATSYIEYKTNLTIKRSLINLMEGKISSVKLILTPYGSFSGRMYVNGSLTNYYYASNGKLELDITSRFKANAGDFTVTLEPYTAYSNMQFYLSDNPPVIEIEYLTNENVRPTKKTFTLAGIATGEVNLANGSMVTSICDVKPENSVMGMGICHIHKRNADNYSLGGNFRLNLNETLVRCDDGDYIYTDSNGDKHGFHDYYYYINNSGVKKYITDKSLIVVDVEGRMTYTESNQTYSVTCEYKSTAGLKAMATLEGVKNADYFEQRTDEYKKVENAFKEYEYGLKEFVRFNTNTGAIIDRFSKYELNATSCEEFKDGLAESEMILPVGEAMNYISALLQVRVLGYQNTSYSQEESSIDLQLASIAKKNGLCPEELGYLTDQATAIENQDDLLDYQKTYYDSAEDDSDQKDYAKSYYTKLKNKIASQKTDLQNQKNYLSVKEDEILNQYDELNLQRSALISQQSNIANIKTENQVQSTHYNSQMTLICEKKDYYLEQFQKMVVEYLVIEKQYKKMQLQLAINFLTDGHYIKGFNAEGKFVALYDRYENYTVIEYESYYEGTEEKSRIARVYDNTEKQVVFGYNEKNQLTAITDIRGRKTCFTYNSNNVLTNIVYDTGENLTITYSNNNIYSLKETKNGLLTYIYYSYNRPTQISHYSTVDNIAVDGETTGNKFISQAIISYNPYSSYPITATAVTDNLVAERYYFDTCGNCTEYRKADFDIARNQYLVSAAEQYTHNPYWIGDEQQSDPKEVVITAARSSLNKTALDSYSFVAGDAETTVIDQFNNPESKTMSAVLVSEWIDSNGISQQNKQTTVVNYIYDDSQLLIEEKTTVTYSNPVKTVVSHKKYNYNAYGDIIRTESYVEGEEYTTGKTIKETVYDGKGNVIKSFIYNSLDTSSKFYTETEYDESNKVSAEFDETGENKTNFGYVDGTNIVHEKALPNGSKFAYGYDYADTVTAISQSTEDGEENSTQKTYRCGEVVELRSGNNNVKYEYDYKRRLKSVGLNGVANYIQYSYAETQDSYGAVAKETVTATYQSGDVFVSEKDGNGNLLKLTANDVDQVENVYDKKGQLDTLKDNVAGKNIKFERDELDNVTAIYEIDSNGIKVSGGYAENVVYDALGKVNKRTITGSVPQEYTYGYKTDSTHALDSITVNGSTIKPKLDVLGRNKGKEIYIGSDKIAEESIVYRKVGDHATNIPATIRFGNKFGENFALTDSLRYAYDKMGNIEKVYENGELAIRYQYDALNRLIREDNKVMNKTVLFAYDNNGNILKQRKFTFTLKNAIDIEELDSEDKVYIYDGDKLLAFNGEECSYNETTNVQTTYRGKALVWTNRRVSSYNGVQFSYDGQGRRIAKDGISYTYDSQGGLLRQSNGLEFFYDHSGVSSVKHDGKTYLYRKDILGNIIALLDTSGAVVVKYTYDAWGNNVVSDTIGAIITDKNHIGNLNPFRYRGYYYDADTKLYYLKTRYYDPEAGRFVSQDSIEYLNSDTINGLNLYAYCVNNPVMNVDPNGTIGILVGILFGVLIGAVVVGTGVAIYAGVTAYNNGARGWDLFGAIAEGFLTGAVIGGIIGGLIAAFIYAAPAIGSFLGSSFQIGLKAAGELVAVTVTGAQIAAAGLAALVGLGIMFARTGKSNGFWGEKYSNDHDPEHFHLKGTDGTDIRIGIDGNPLKGERGLTAQQRKALKKLWEQIMKLFE